MSKLKKGQYCVWHSETGWLLVHFGVDDKLTDDTVIATFQDADDCADFLLI